MMGGRLFLAAWVQPITASKSGTRYRIYAALLATRKTHCYIYRSRGRRTVRDTLYQRISRHMLLGMSIGLCWFGLSLSQASADSPPPSVSGSPDACERVEDCFQSAALPRERFGKTLTKEQVLLLKLDHRCARPAQPEPSPVAILVNPLKGRGSIHQRRGKQQPRFHRFKYGRGRRSCTPIDDVTVTA